jgi:hypothetical protein
MKEGDAFAFGTAWANVPKFAGVRPIVRIDTLGGRAVTGIEMEVEENFGQSAIYRVTYA